MKRQLYVTSKSLKSGTRLIGILSEENGKYEFEYKLGGFVQEWFLVIKEFPNVSIKYRGSEVERFIERIIPSKDAPYLDKMLENANVIEYDTWELLKAFGKKNKKEDAYLYEVLPEGTLMYEQL